MTTIPQHHFDLDYIESIIQEYDKDILIALGFEPDRYGRVQCACKIHGGDNPQGFSYDPRKRRWRCWTHHCHESTTIKGKQVDVGTGVIGLVRAIRQCTFRQACQWILDVTGNNGKNLDPSDINRKRYINQQKQFYIDSNEKIYSESLISERNHQVSYFLNENFSSSILERFKTFEPDNDKTKPLFGRACFPIYNVFDQVVGFAGRRTKKIPDTTPKWWYAGGVELGNHLFGLNLVRSYIEASKTAILVEGPKDVMKCHQAGLLCTVSSFSNKLSDNQRKLLISCGVRNLILALDPDLGGNIGTNDIIDKSNLFFNIYDIHNLLEKDPGEMSEEEIQNIILPEFLKILAEDNKRYGN